MPPQTRLSRSEGEECFWTELNSTVSRVPNNYHLFVSVDTNPWAGVGAGEEGGERGGTHRRGSRVGHRNGTVLLRLPGDSRFVLPERWVSTPKEARHVSQRLGEQSRERETYCQRHHTASP